MLLGCLSPDELGQTIWAIGILSLHNTEQHVVKNYETVAHLSQDQYYGCLGRLLSVPNNTLVTCH